MIKLYKLSDPRYPDDIRYIGQTSKSLKNRLSIHISPKSLISKTHKNNWIKSLLDINILPSITLLEEVSIEEWNTKEIFWIKFYRDLGYRLTNSTDGGEGMLNPNEETRKKLSIASSGDKNPNFGIKRSDKINKKINDIRVIIHTEETKKIIGEKSLGRKHTDKTKKIISEANIGKVVSEETRRKISESQIGKVVSEETKEKLSEACSGEKNGFYGKEHTEETKQKLSNYRKGKKLSEDIRKKMSESQMGEKNGFFGKKHTEETKEKMSESRRIKKELKLKEESESKLKEESESK